jgi:hypothetical protein
MHAEIWRYTTAKAMLRLANDGLIGIQVIGLVGAGDLALMRRDAVIAMGLPGARAMLVDFRRASILFGNNNVPLPDAPIPPALAGMPVAIVCSEVDEDLFLTHAWHQARAGLTRAVFTDPAAASAWALQRAGGSSAWVP